MTNKEAINWIINLSADIGKAEHRELWHYEQALYEIREMLESAQPTESSSCSHENDLISRQAAIDVVCKDCEYYYNENVIQDLKDLPSAQPEPQWIPCSERLPEKEQAYLVTHYNTLKQLKVDRIMYRDGEWKTAWTPIAWMPLPEPYTERREE